MRLTKHLLNIFPLLAFPTSTITTMIDTDVSTATVSTSIGMYVLKKQLFSTIMFEIKERYNE